MKTRQVCELSGVLERGVMGQMAPPILQIGWEGHSRLAICWDGMIVQVECVQDQEWTHRSGKVWTKLKNRLFGWKLSRTGQRTKNDIGGEHCAQLKGFRNGYQPQITSQNIWKLNKQTLKLNQWWAIINEKLLLLVGRLAWGRKWKPCLDSD